MFRRLSALMLAAGLTVPAAAQSPLPQDVVDGMYVTVAEVRANSESTFKAFAPPGATSVTRGQFVSMKLPAGVMESRPDRAMLGKLFSVLDANGDGTLTISEWRQRLQKDIQFADANSDGKISLKELANARENMGVGDALGMVF